jgi:uncharacterized membrane protein YidH (DUF202 family)
VLKLSCVIKAGFSNSKILKKAIRRKFRVKNSNICFVEGIIMVICV